MENEDGSGDEFGQQTPPLSVFLQKILVKYPDGRQLFELLQNADDAGAVDVKFILDNRTHQSLLAASDSSSELHVCKRDNHSESD